MEGTLQHHAAQQQQRHAHQQQQLNLQLQHQMDTLQHQISNMHLEFDANNRNNVGIAVGVHSTAARGTHKNLKQNYHHQQHQQQHQVAQHAASPSSSSTSSMTSASTINGRSCGGRRHILPRYPDADPDAIEICTDEQEKHINNRKVPQYQQEQQQQQQFYHHHSLEQQHQHMQHMGNITLDNPDNLHDWATAPTLHSAHDYSYAYYEPGVPMRHSNIPTSSLMLETPSLSPSTPPQTPTPNSIRALLSKGKKNKLLVSAATWQSYQSRYKMRTNAEQHSAPIQQHNTLPHHSNNGLMLHENFYEEISSTETIEASPRNHIRPSATYHSAGSLNQSLVEEELRRVQTRHRKILGELNLSVEVMLMPKSPQLPLTCVPNHHEDINNSETTPASVTSMPIEQHAQCSRMSSKRLNSAASADNIVITSQLQEEPTLATTAITNHHNNNIAQSGFCAADLDSGFSGSSGASYIGSLRLQKTNAALTQLKFSRQTSQNSSENNFTTMCSFPYATQSCRNFHSTGTGTGTVVGHVSGSGACVNKLSTVLPPEDEANDAGFFIRSPCGRVLNCAKIRAAAADNNVNATNAPTESIARTFWHRKGWRKLPGLSNSTSSINNTGLTATTATTPTNTLKLLQPFVSSYIYLKRSTTFRKT